MVMQKNGSPPYKKKSKRNRNEKKEKENTSSEIKARNVRKQSFNEIHEGK